MEFYTDKSIWVFLDFAQPSSDRTLNRGLNVECRFKHCNTLQKMPKDVLVFISDGSNNGFVLVTNAGTQNNDVKVLENGRYCCLPGNTIFLKMIRGKEKREKPCLWIFDLRWLKISIYEFFICVSIKIFKEM